MKKQSTKKDIVLLRKISRLLSNIEERVLKGNLSEKNKLIKHLEAANRETTHVILILNNGEF
jgi:hypothetical protein